MSKRGAKKGHQKRKEKKTTEKNKRAERGKERRWKEEGGDGKKNKQISKARISGTPAHND